MCSCDTVEIPAEFVRQDRRHLWVRYDGRVVDLPRPQCSWDDEDGVVVMPIWAGARMRMVR